jgi:hypothetical protein
MLLLLNELEENFSQARDAFIKAFHCPTKNSTKEAKDLLDASF